MRLRLSLIAAVCLAASPAAWAQVVQPLSVELHTTSDDVEVEFTGLDFRVVKSTVESATGTTQSPLKPLHIKKQPWDTSPLTVRADVLVTPTDAPIAVKVTRGCPGDVQLTLRAAGRVVLQQHWPEAAVPQAKGKGKKSAPIAKKPEGRGPREWVVPLRADKVLLAPPLPRKAFEPMVLAYHYGWYGRPDGLAKEWLHWNPAVADHGSTHAPQLGWYDSADPKIVRQQIAWAQEAGVDGFILSWWTSWDRKVLAELLKQADAKRFAVSLYLEAAATPAEFHKQLLEIEALAKGHPSFLRVEGKPVVFVYGRILYALGNDGVREALKDTHVFVIGDALEAKTFTLLDGAAAYMALDWPDQQHEHLINLQRTARLHDKLLVASVAPGYDDSHIRSPGRIDQRLDGQFYESMWSSAKRADWVVITSWNEWHEGSEIEPSAEFGKKYLELTRKFVDRWRR